MKHQHAQLIQELLSCAMICEHCATECLTEKNIDRLRGCIMLDRDCADICLLTAQLLKRDSAVGHHMLHNCEEVCRMCYDECKKHSHMSHCKECAEACIKCADACQVHLELI